MLKLGVTEDVTTSARNSVQFKNCALLVLEQRVLLCAVAFHVETLQPLDAFFQSRSEHVPLRLR